MYSSSSTATSPFPFTGPSAPALPTSGTKLSPPAASPLVTTAAQDIKPSTPAASPLAPTTFRAVFISGSHHPQGYRSRTPLPSPPPHLRHCPAIWGDLLLHLRVRLPLVTLEDVAECVKDAKISADRAARLAGEEHKRTISALRRQREEVLSASPDTERELHLAALYSHQYSTEPALSVATTQHQAFLVGPQPAALQPSAPATHAARAALKPAPLQPPALATHAARSASQRTALQPPARASHVACAATNPATTQPSAPAA